MRKDINGYSTDQKPIHPLMQAGDNGNGMQDGQEQVQAFDDPLLQFNRSAIWTTDVNLDWFMEHPLWNSPEVML
jgi:ubiquitin